MDHYVRWGSLQEIASLQPFGSDTFSIAAAALKSGTATKSEPKPAFEEDFYVICHNHSFVSLLSPFLPYFLYRRISTRKEQSSPMPMPKAMMSQK